jgi:hypothetical protein
MHAAVRPYATAGVALVGASVIAVSPIHPPLPDIQVHNPVAQLAALADPFQAYTQVFQEAVANVEPILADAAANPTPILTKIVQNQIASLEALLALIPTTTAGALTAPTTTASANSTPNPPATSHPSPGDPIPSCGDSNGSRRGFHCTDDDSASAPSRRVR